MPRVRMNNYGVLLTTSNLLCLNYVSLEQRAVAKVVCGHKKKAPVLRIEETDAFVLII